MTDLRTLIDRRFPNLIADSLALDAARALLCKAGAHPKIEGAPECRECKRAADPGGWARLRKRQGR